MIKDFRKTKNKNGQFIFFDILQLPHIVISNSKKLTHPIVCIFYFTNRISYVKFRTGNSLIGFSSESLVFCERKSDVSESLTVALLLWAKGANRSICSLKKSKWAKRDMGDSLSAIKSGKTVKNIQKYEFFEWIARFACNSLESRANHSHRSFLKSDESDFQRRAKERIPNPVICRGGNWLLFLCTLV